MLYALITSQSALWDMLLNAFLKSISIRTILCFSRFASLVIQSGDVEIESFEQENYKMTEAGSGVAACGSLWWRL